MTWLVRSGFNRGLGAVGTLAVWLQKGGVCVCVCEGDGRSVSGCVWMGDGWGYISLTRRGRSWPS